MLQTMCLRHDVFSNQVFETNHLISQALLKLCINRYQMAETRGYLQHI
jgi:hypothetical protein